MGKLEVTFLIIFLVVTAIIGFVFFKLFFKKESYVGSGGGMPGLPNRALFPATEESRAIINREPPRSPGCILRDEGCIPHGVYLDESEIRADAMVDQEKNLKYRRLQNPLVPSAHLGAGYVLPFSSKFEQEKNIEGLLKGTTLPAATSRKVFGTGHGPIVASQVRTSPTIPMITAEQAV